MKHDEDVDVIHVYRRIQDARKKGCGVNLSYREVIAIMCDGAVRQALDTAEYEDKKSSWVCNQCGSSEYTGSVSENDFDDDGMSCGGCGGTEFHWE